MEDHSSTRSSCSRTTLRVGPMASGRKKSMNELALRSSSTPKISRVITGGEAQESCTQQQQLCLSVFKSYYFNFTFNVDVLYFHNANVLTQRLPLLIPSVLLSFGSNVSLCFARPISHSFGLCVSSRGWFWGFEETRARNVTCMSAQGHASIMAPVLQKNITVT